MSSPIISVEHLGKDYTLSHQDNSAPYRTLRDTISSWFSPKKKQRGNTREIFHALDDISFDVQPGEVLGIIGRNGAGKSTLLKILSRITEPTRGRVTLRGRVASLLEVGTGFHPELTGRENIFLNGAILGMSRGEIREKFDAIVDFAGIGQFLDTPVKRYSSGMYVRLAFAVAAHLDPEILIVDEVLAVGDAAFQKKCLGKMREVAHGQGRTVLFVSHNLAAIESLTHRVVILEQGRLQAIDTPAGARDRYLSLLSPASSPTPPDWGRGPHSTVTRVALVNDRGEPATTYLPGTPFRLAVDIRTSGHPNLSFEVFLKSDAFSRVAMASLWHFHNKTLPPTPGLHRCLIDLGPLALASGDYSLDAATSIPHVTMDHQVENALSFAVPSSLHGTPPFDFKKSYGFGCLALPCASIRCETSP